MKDRIEKEIKYFEKKALANIQREVEYFKEQIAEMVRRYKEIVEELAQLPKLTDKEIIFAHTEELSNSSGIQVEKWGDELVIRTAKGGYNIPLLFEAKPKVKIIIYRE